MSTDFATGLRRGSWLTVERATAYAGMAVACYVVVGAVRILGARGLVDAFGLPVGADFTSFWAAGSLALKGLAPAAYDAARHAAEEQLPFGAAVPYFAWYYPPCFLLVVAAFAWLPYAGALAAWSAMTVAVFVASARALIADGRAVLLALAFPGTFVNLVNGQNGLLSAALLGGGLVLLESRPLWAGALFAGLAYKPQFAVLVPFALLAGGHWRALFAGASALAFLLAVTTLAFGIGIWPAFAGSLAPAQQTLLAAGAPGFYKMVTVYSSLRMWGAGAAVAWVLQAASSLAMLALVARAWRGPGPLLLKGALLVAATPLATPYALDYDLAILAIPVACVVREARGAWRPWEAAIVSLAFVTPGAARALAFATAFPLSPVACALLVWIVVRRLADERAKPAASGGPVAVQP